MFDFLTAGSLAAPIVGMLETDGFVCNLFGDSGTGKSVTNKIVCSLWSGYTSREGFLFSADNKINGMESILDALNNIPLVLEDLNNMSETAQKNMQSFIMKIANGVGKIRAKINMSIQRVRTWNTTALMTSENRVTKDFHNTGAVNRVLLYKADRYPYEGGPENAGELLAPFTDNYGFAGQEFIAALKELGRDKVEEMVNGSVKAISAIARARGKSQRQVLPVAIMLTADRIAEKYIFKDGKHISAECALSWMADADEANQYNRFYDYVMQTVQVNIPKFEKTDDKPGLFGSSDDASSGWNGYEYWGKYDEAGGYVCILSQPLRDMADTKNIDTKMFISYLENKGLLVVGKKSKTVNYRSKVFKKTMRGYQIKMPEYDKEEVADTDTSDEDAAKHFLDVSDIDDTQWPFPDVQPLKKDAEKKGGLSASDEMMPVPVGGPGFDNDVLPFI